jgi:diguanylate cyclase (GGDEF)-like protein
VRRLAEAATAVSERSYSLDAELSPGRTPGTPVRDELCQLADGFHLMTTMIHAHEQELRKLVLLDELTGLYNADHFREQFPIELGKGKRYGHPTSLIVVDLAGLEGAAASDQDKLRVRAASFLLNRLRRVDMLFRVARDRFAAILPETPDAGAAVAAGRIENYSADVTTPFSFPASLSVTSMGWAPDAEVSADDIVRRLTSERGGRAE